MKRNVLFVLGIVAIIVLVSRLPADVFATTQAMLVLASGAILLALAFSVFFTPARRLVGRLFTFDVQDAPPFAMAREAEWRDMAARPLLAALVAMAVAGLPTLIR